MTTDITPQTMKSLIGSRFTVVAFDLSLTLVAVDQLQAGESDRPFALVFEGPSDRMLDQGIWPLHVDDDRAFEIFLTPLGPQPSGSLGYEAVYN